MNSENLKLLLNNLLKSEDTAEIEKIRSEINSQILSSKEGTLIKSFIDWNASVDILTQNIQNRLKYNDINYKVFTIMNDLILELYQDNKD